MNQILLVILIHKYYINCSTSQDKTPQSLYHLLACQSRRLRKHRRLPFLLAYPWRWRSWCRLRVRCAFCRAGRRSCCRSREGWSIPSTSWFRGRAWLIPCRRRVLWRLLRYLRRFWASIWSQGACIRRWCGQVCRWSSPVSLCICKGLPHPSRMYDRHPRPEWNRDHKLPQLEV